MIFMVDQLWVWSLGNGESDQHIASR
jgi:hypothetical protein